MLPSFDSDLAANFRLSPPELAHAFVHQIVSDLLTDRQGLRALDLEVGLGEELGVVNGGGTVHLNLAEVTGFAVLDDCRPIA